MPVLERTPIREFADFVVSRPTLKDLITFELSDENVAWMDDLLDKNREGMLTAEERSQLEHLLQLEDLIRMIKIAAQEKLDTV